MHCTIEIELNLIEQSFILRLLLFIKVYIDFHLLLIYFLIKIALFYVQIKLQSVYRSDFDWGKDVRMI